MTSSKRRWHRSPSLSSLGRTQKALEKEKKRSRTSGHWKVQQLKDQHASLLLNLQTKVMVDPGLLRVLLKLRRWIPQTPVQEKSSLRQAVAVKWAAITGEDPPPREDDSVPVSWATIADTEYEVSTSTFGESVGVVINWLQGLSQSADSEVQWVTFYQLVVDFQRQTGQNGVRYNVVDKCWMPLTDRELIQEFPFTRVSQCFGAFLRSLAKKLSEVFHVQSARPTSTSFARWNKCLRISVPKGRMQDIDNLWKSHGIVPIKHVTSSFRGKIFVERLCGNT